MTCHADVRGLHAAAVLVLTAAVFLVGCTMSAKPDPTPTHTAAGLTWQEAKKTTQAVEKQISGSIDPADVASITQQPKGSLLSCTADTWQWAGSTTVVLKSPDDITAVLAQMQAHWSAQPGFVTTAGNDSADGSPTLDVRRGDVEGYLVGLSPDNRGLLIES